nr:MAG TPA: hypothetical protein [Caudoviricetes sp.]DAI58427.1 MAG TPA: hypothetical protein [Crassvirales sp.]
MEYNLLDCPITLRYLLYFLLALHSYNESTIIIPAKANIGTYTGEYKDNKPPIALTVTFSALLNMFLNIGIVCSPI